MENLTMEHFAPHIGTPFFCRLPNGPDCEMTLVEATGAGKPSDRNGASALPMNPALPFRPQPFSLLFLGPPDFVLPQSIYSLEHAHLGTLPIFLVPTGREANGVRYQAIFT